MATTTATPGNIVVPLSTILDQLKGKLTDAEVNQLVASILGARQSQVQPGQRIAAALVNQMLTDIDGLLIRVAKLEGSAPSGVDPVIFQVVPAQVRAGDPLRVIGQNFDTPADSNVVTVAGIAINRFDETSDSNLLRFNVPLLSFSGSSLATQVTVRTRSGRSPASADLVVLPQLQIPKGFVVITQDSANRLLGTLDKAPAPPLDIGLIIDSQTDIAESYTFSFTYTDVAGPASLSDWIASTSLRLANGTALSASQPVVIDPSTPAKLIARVQAPPNSVPNTSSANLVLRITSVNNDSGLSRNADPLSLVAGQKLPFNDPRVEWANEVPSQPTPTNKARRTLDTTTGAEYVEIPFGASGLANLRANFKQNGAYTYTASIDPAAVGVWAPVNWSPKSSPGKNAGEDELIGVLLNLLASPGPTHSEARTVTLKAVRTPPPGAPATDTETFTSWITLNIRGYQG